MASQGVLEKKIDEEFNASLRNLPWVLQLLAGEIDDTSDISTNEFVNGLIMIQGAIHRNVLRLAREIDSLSG
jgi:hypothetical protein